MPEISFSTLTLFDYGVVLALVVSAAFSTLRGMTREFLGLSGWLVSILVSYLSASTVEDWLSDILAVEGLAEVLSWTVPFAGTAVLWFVFASLISPGLKNVGLGSLDTWFGVVFGLIRGAFLISLFYVVCALFVQSESNLPPFMKDSQSSPYIHIIASGFTPLLPDEWQSRLSVIEPGQNLTEDVTQPVEEQVDQLSDGLELRDDERS